MDTDPCPASLDVPKSDPVVEQVIDAGFACIARTGFDGTTIDDIVRESGVPRTTVYRKVGGREAILRAVLARMAIPYQRRCAVIAAQPGSFADRMEAIIVVSVTIMDDYPWLKLMLRGGLSQASFAIVEDAGRSVPSNVIRSLLAQRIAEGSWTPSVSLDEVTHWMLRQILTLGGEPFTSEAQVQRHVRAFIMPVLLQ